MTPDWIGLSPLTLVLSHRPHRLLPLPCCFPHCNAFSSIGRLWGRGGGGGNGPPANDSAHTHMRPTNRTMRINHSGVRDALEGGEVPPPPPGRPAYAQPLSP